MRCLIELGLHENLPVKNYILRYLFGNITSVVCT